MFFACLSFFGFVRFAESKGERYNTYNENYYFRFLHDGYDYNHSVDNSASLENPRHQVQHLSTTYQILHFQHCSVFVFVRNCFTILVVQEGLLDSTLQIPDSFQWNFDFKFQY